MIGLRDDPGFGPGTQQFMRNGSRKIATASQGMGGPVNMTLWVIQGNRAFVAALNCSCWEAASSAWLGRRSVAISTGGRTRRFRPPRGSGPSMPKPGAWAGLFQRMGRCGPKFQRERTTGRRSTGLPQSRPNSPCSPWADSGESTPGSGVLMG